MNILKTKTTYHSVEVFAASRSHGSEKLPESAYAFRYLTKTHGTSV